MVDKPNTGFNVRQFAAALVDEVAVTARKAYEHDRAIEVMTTYARKHDIQLSVMEGQFYHADHGSYFGTTDHLSDALRVLFVMLDNKFLELEGIHQHELEKVRAEYDKPDAT